VPETDASMDQAPRRKQLRIPNWIRHPLWWMPDIPAEQNRSFEGIWRQFSGLERVEDGRHDTEAWSNRQGEFVLCCVRIPTETLGAEFQELREKLEALQPLVRLHPPEFLHITVQEIGFVAAQPVWRDEFTQARLDEFLSYIEAPIADFSPFTVQLAGLNSFTDAAFLDVRDNGWLSRIHYRMRDFVIFPPNKHFPYLPVTTFAHYTKKAPAAELIELLTPYRDTVFGSFQVNEIDVVRLRVDEPYPPLQIERTIRLGRHRLEAPVRPLPIEPLENGV
jgi:2'-5' RNA ligase